VQHLVHSSSSIVTPSDCEEWLGDSSTVRRGNLDDRIIANSLIDCGSVPIAMLVENFRCTDHLVRGTLEWLLTSGEAND